MDLSGKTNVSSISDPKGIAFGGYFLWVQNGTSYNVPA